MVKGTYIYFLLNHYTGVQSINNVYAIVNKVENVLVNTHIFDLIDNGVYVIYALYSSIIGMVEGYTYVPVRIELVFHIENSMKYRSLHTILKYRFNIPFRYIYTGLQIS